MEESKTTEKEFNHYDPEDYCGECGSSVFWEDCWQCGGKGGRDGEDLMAEDPLWYDQNSWETCDICEGKGGFNMCLNSNCK